MPADTVAANLLAGRGPVADRMSWETQEIFKRLLRAHLNLEQAQEYLRQRLNKIRTTECWSLEDLFKVVDRDENGSISVYDLERLIIEHKKGGSRSIVEEIELVIAMYDKTGYHKISFSDFSD